MGILINLVYIAAIGCLLVGAVGGFLLGIAYIEARLQKSPPLPWMLPLRIGWHIFGFAVVTWLSLPIGWVPRLCNLGMLLACIIWLNALIHYFREQKRP